ncbi:MAG: DUF819 family protein [Flavobacteriaceae bacterium]|nr:DUF819 family protein [Flavobacteriaceae bacterium]
MQLAIFNSDPMVFGVLVLLLGIIFYTASLPNFKKFYTYVPVVLMCYLAPAILSSLGVIPHETETISFFGKKIMLPAALVLLTLSIDLKAIANLGPKALIMFFTGTIGIILGGPIAMLIVGAISPESVGGVGADAIWRGLTTLAGSWIGGGANQIAMLEIFEYNPKGYTNMLLIDIIVGNVWMALVLLGVGKATKIDKWLKADTSAIDALKERVSSFQEASARIPSLKDLVIMVALTFFAVAMGHEFGGYVAEYLAKNVHFIADKTSFFSFLGGKFFWLIVVATIFGIVLSFTKAKNYEGAGASKIGSLFIYILVAVIGMSMDLSRFFEKPGLLAVGAIWILIHAILLIAVAKIIKAPFFFLAVGSQANVGGAASAPIVASEFHNSLASVGVLLGVLGYVVGTGGAIVCAYLLEMASKVGM